MFFTLFLTDSLNTRTAGVAINLQRPAAVILTASTKTRFAPVYAWCGCNVSVEQILRSHNFINLSTKTVLLKGKGKNWTQNWKKFHICIAANKTHSESSVAVHLQYAVLLHLKQSLLVLF